MTNTIPKRGDVFFCQGSPDAIGSEERKTRPVVIIKLDDCLAVSFGMTRQAAQEAAHSAPEAQDDIFRELTRNGLSVAVCPLPVLNQVNITITDGKTVSMTRNVAPAGGIVAELLDMKDTLKEVTP